MAPHPSSRSPARRSFLTAGAAVAAGAAFGGLITSGRWANADDADDVMQASGATVSETEVRPSALPVVTGPRRLDEVMADATASVGQRLLGSPWESAVVVEGWSAAWVAWLLRGMPGMQDVSTAAQLALALGQPAAPRPAVGAVVLYAPGTGVEPDRAGFVVGVTRGVAQTLEGDHPVLLPRAERFVRRLPQPAPGTVRYVLPEYAK